MDLPTHQTSTAQLPRDLRTAIGVAAREASSFGLVGRQSDFASAIMFSWSENGEMLTCRAVVRGHQSFGFQPDRTVRVYVWITDEHSAGGVITADAYQGVWDMLHELGDEPARLSDGAAMISAPLSRLIEISS